MRSEAVGHERGIRLPAELHRARAAARAARNVAARLGEQLTRAPRPLPVPLVEGSLVQATTPILAVEGARWRHAPRFGDRFITAMSQYASEIAGGCKPGYERSGRTGAPMTDQPLTAIPRPSQVPAIPARLEPDAIGVAQDTIIGLASSAPAATMAVTLAGMAATAAYGGGPVIILCGIPMLILANPYLGFLVGWMMLAGCLTGTISVVVVLSPAVLAVFGASAIATWPNILLCTAVILVMATIAVVGIRLTARTQVGMALIEYAILIGISVWALLYVLGHHRGTFPPTKGWLSLNGIDGKGNLAAGLLIAVFMYTGWDATVYVNEEVKHRRVNPGRAAVFAVALLVIMYVLPQVGMQGVASPARLQANASSALVFVAQVLGGGGWANVMAFALALSVIASTNVGIVITSRIAYGMASHRVLPPVLGNVSRRYSTPAIGTIIIAVILIAATWAYLLSTSIATVFTYVVSTTGLLFAGFYTFTALSAVFYYRRRIFT